MTAAAGVLLVEDNPGDARLIREMLAEPGGEAFRLIWVDRLARGLDHLDGGSVQVVLLDLSLPDSLGLDTYLRMHARAPQVPVIVLTGTHDDALALAAVKTGAQDYLVKGEVSAGLLLRAMRYAIERKQAERALRESEERYALAAAGANDGLWDWNLRERRVYFSPRWKAMIGHAAHEIGDDPAEWLDRVHPDDIDGLRLRIDRHLQGADAALHGEYRLRHKDGRWRWMLCRGLAVRSGGAPAHRMAGSQTDIDERKQTEARLRHDALHDGLTGLANRTKLMDRLTLAVERSRRDPGKAFALLFIDLDRFKKVNDGCGHDAGDRLLVECARRLAAGCRPGDTLARLAGDEFVVLLEDVLDGEDALQVARRMQEHLRAPFNPGCEEIFVTASIGVALARPECLRPEDLLRDADTAMYRAKAEGKARCVLFDASMQVRALAFLQIEADLRHAAQREELRLHYQPVVALHDERVAGFEALLRWQHPRRGMVPPAEFIPIAEQAGLIGPIGSWALRQACRQLRSWQAERPGLEAATVSVNLSGRQFAQAELADEVAETLAETRLAPGCLGLEITESFLIANPDLASGILHRLRALGVRISVDDFGTGYSSLNYLHRLPVDVLKVDRSFVGSLGESEESDEIVLAILGLAKALRVEVVAEGLETPAQVERLRAWGCDYGQGLVFAPPLAEAAALALLQRGGPARHLRQ